MTSRLLLRVTALALGGVLAACGRTPTTASAEAPPPPSPRTAVPVLSVPVVDMALVNDFLPFGMILSSGRVNPTYELRTPPDAVVRAAGPGVVVNILSQPVPDGDFEIHVRPPDAAEYLVIYDHVVTLRVAVGQSVAAGQVLGSVGAFARVGRTELQVNRTSGAATAALCPRQLGTAEFNAAHDAALARFPGRGSNVCLATSVEP